MANALPIVIKSGQVQQLQSGDLLVDPEGHGYVDAAAAFGTTDLLVSSDGVARGVKATAIASGDVVTAASAFSAGNKLLRAGGADKSVQGSPVDLLGTTNFLAIGDGAGASRTTGNGVYLGTSAGASVTTGQFNTVIGVEAFDAAETVSFCVAVGTGALGNVTAGSANFAVGTNALLDLTSGSGNIGFGNGALRDLGTTAGTWSRNTAVGHIAGQSLLSGDDNTFIGSEAGNNASQKTDASNSIAIGRQAHTTADNQAVLGPDTITQTILRGSVESDGGFGFYGDTPPAAQPTHITDASVAHALNVTFDDTEVEAALDALGGKINDILVLLESYGIVADS